MELDLQIVHSEIRERRFQSLKIYVDFLICYFIVLDCVFFHRRRPCFEFTYFF